MTDVITVQTSLTVEHTIARLQSLLAEKGITVFAIYDHAANAREVGLELAGETVIVFGSPEVGTALMKDNPDVGYELPLRILVRDDAGVARVVYRDPRALIPEYRLTHSQPTVERLSGLLRDLTSRSSLGRHSSASSRSAIW